MVSFVNYVQITVEELNYGIQKAEDASKLASELNSFSGIISQTEFETKLTTMKGYIDSLIQLKTAIEAIESNLP
jgi:hypothetical protein